MPYGSYALVGHKNYSKVWRRSLISMIVLGANTKIQYRPNSITSKVAS